MTLQRRDVRREPSRHQLQQRAFAVVDRRDGFRCVMCDAPAPRGRREHSHRAHAGMGGSAKSFRASNLLISCGPFGCNWKLSHDADFAELGRRNGWLIPRDANPTTTPVLYRGTWVLLDDNGDITDAAGITPNQEGNIMHDGPSIITDERTAEPGEALPVIDQEHGEPLDPPIADNEPQNLTLDPLAVAIHLLKPDVELALRNGKGLRAGDRIALAQALATHSLAAAIRAQNDLLYAQHQMMLQASRDTSRLVVPAR